MKITLEKNITLHSAVVYLRFEKNVKREDIQEYLKGKHFDNPLIENRVRDYLKNIRVYDEKHQLTALGNAIKETGILPTAEEGKYQIWYTNNDSHFGNKILYFKRLQPSRDNKGGKITLRLDVDGHILLPTENNDYSTLNLAPTQDYLGEQSNTKDTIMLNWTWDGLEKSHYLFSGQLGSSNNLITLKKQTIPCKENLKLFIDKLLPSWDKKQERLRIYFDKIQNESKLRFEDNQYTSKWSDFDVKIQNLPLMPYDTEEAKKWRDWLLNEELKKNYLNPHDFEAITLSVNEKAAFNSYDMGVSKARDFVKRTESKIAYWHLIAPLDLNSNKILTTHTAKVIELKEGEQISFSDIVEKLGLTDIDNNSILVYYDRFVIKQHQHKAVIALNKAINCAKKIVITDLKKDNSSDFIQKNCSEIKIQDIKTVFPARSPHDRYLIVGNQATISIWNVSNSTDYIYFSDNVIDNNTIGTIKQSVVFAPMSKETLSQELLNFINQEIKNGK